MSFRTRLQHLGVVSALPLALSLSATLPALAQAKPSLFSKATSITAEDPGKVVEAKVWLNLRDKSTLDDAVAKLYDKNSPTYHQWLKDSDLARYSPTATDLETVKSELARQGLTVKEVGHHNMYLRVVGPVAKMEAAFHTEIKSLTIKGEAVRATTTQPKLGGEAGSLVAAVAGLTQRRMKSDALRASDPESGKPYPFTPVKAMLAAHPDGVFYSNACFRAVHTETFRTPGASLPIGQYVGNRYGANITNTANGTLPPCGYDVADVTTPYGLQTAYKIGLNGAGQTIVIVDAYGSDDIQNDANIFSALNGLPKLTSANFQVIYPGGTPQPTTPGNADGWKEETSLDVEWAHAIAPGANIVLLASPSDYDNDLQTTVFYGVSTGFGGVISNSYSGAEIEDIDFYPENLVINNSISELAASLGISLNFSTGDDGDLAAAIGTTSVSDLGDSPYATAVGGTSLAVQPSGNLAFQTGWGNNFQRLALATGAPVDPPLSFGFQYGSGGGESQFFAKPSWQSSLPGTGRQQPDVSLVADPDTGVELVVTIDGVQQVGVIGGTSLSCPAFSGFWAIVAQRASQITGSPTIVGQAAPIVAALSGTSAITDVTDYTSPSNVAGTIYDSSGATFYSAADLGAPLNGTTSFYSAIYNSPASGRWDVFTFGTDSSLVAGPGWDNVTGYGTPSGINFINKAAALAVK